MSTLSATNRSRQKVLGYPVDVVDEEQAIAVVESAWNLRRGLQIVTLNAEMIVAAQQDAELDRIIRHAHLIVPDGAGVVWAVKLNGQPINRLPGIELSAALLGRAALNGRKVALLGGKPEVVENLQAVLLQKFPGLKIVAARHGYFSLDDEERIVDELAKYEPELILVALGVPKQEYFIDRWHSSFPSSVMVGVGGSFDVWTGQVKRAPAYMRQLNLEWLYRLVSEPWRYKRILSCLPNFFFQVLQDALKGFPSSKNKNPGQQHPEAAEIDDSQNDGSTKEA
ncbi:MAG: WecB/TagA/CpsF family glycosyltransferase [Candidatus Obscuribacterales bacterium]|nr:WecB/TagA/CpsF family glycosyltransferase [Candidatus Obscuribacterales bacterium]